MGALALKVKARAQVGGHLLRPHSFTEAFFQNDRSPAIRRSPGRRVRWRRTLAWWRLPEETGDLPGGGRQWSISHHA